jgi:hypothetical protein
MAKSLKKGFVFILLFILTSCMDRLDNRYLTITNNSDKIIYNIISPNESLNGSGHYDEYLHDENTYILTREDSINKFVFLEIKPNINMNTNDRPRNWDLYFESINDKKMRLFIIEKDSVDKYGWKEILNKNIYNKKYLFTIKDLDSLNWTITYDGN